MEFVIEAWMPAFAGMTQEEPDPLPVLDPDWIQEYSKAMRVALRVWLSFMLAIVLAAVPAWAGDSETFDPDQPFNSLHGRLFLESLAGQALDLLKDHLEISADTPSGENGSLGRQSLRFKFYPDGRSKSDQYFAAEGWLGPSSDAQRQELHFRFSLPGASSTPGQPQSDNVL